MLKINLLTKKEFEATFLIGKMHHVSHAAEEMVDLWAYADEVIVAWQNMAPDWHWAVSWIYENELYQHIGIPIPQDNAYLVVIVDKIQRAILGHHILNLNQLYGLN